MYKTLESFLLPGTKMGTKYIYQYTQYNYAAQYDSVLQGRC